MNDAVKMIYDNIMLKIWIGSRGTWETKDVKPACPLKDWDLKCFYTLQCKQT